MHTWLFLGALLAQSLDAQSSCANIKNGFKEVNPIYGNTCKSIVIRKSLLFTPYILIFEGGKWSKVYSIGLIGGGAIGFTINIKQR
jgi:hypothetical protein